jgi:peptidyl-prolyl cis-trans isomerase SurA
VKTFGPLSFARVALIALALAASAGVVDAQSVQRIAAVVNDEVISVYDLESRTMLVIATSGMPDNAETRRRVQPQVLRNLIDERLQVQEANRLNASVNEREIDEAIQRVERANNMQPGQLSQELANIGVDRNAIASQIKAGLAWQKVVSRRLRPALQVGQDEIDEVLERINANRGAVEYLLAELFLSVETPEQEDEVRQTMENILDQMRRGSAFQAMAQQFSQSASASTGGDIGWVERSQLEDEVVQFLDQMQNGRATPPIRTATGFYVYLLREKRTLAAPAPEDATVSLAQLILPVEPNATEADVASQTELAETVRESITGCADLKRVAGELGLPGGDPTPELRIGDLNPAIRPVVSGLKADEAAKPIRGDSGVILVMVCARKEPPSNLPSREDIAENLTRQRLDLIARRHLRDLRRAAFIDVRV